MADSNTSFHEGTTAPVGETSSYGWTPGGEAPAPADNGAVSAYGYQPGDGAAPADAGAKSSYGWSGGNDA